MTTNYRNITGSGGALFSVKPKSALIPGDPNDTWGEAIGEASEKTWRMGKNQLAPSLLVTPWCQVTRLVKKTQDARTNNMVVQKTNEINRRLQYESVSLIFWPWQQLEPLCQSAVERFEVQRFWWHEKQAESPNLRMQHPTRLLHGPSSASTHQHIQHIQH